MRIAQINMVHFGSTGKIMFQIAKTAGEQGFQTRTYSTYLAAKHVIKLPPAPEGHTYYGSWLNSMIDRALVRVFGGAGFYSRWSTQKLVRELKTFDPHVLHLHNLHSGHLYLPALFKYARKRGVQVIWTLHDEWAFTGHCAYSIMAKCERWKTGCGNCPVWQYAVLGPDRSARDFKKKKALFTSLETEKLVLAPPSQWLADLTKESFLGKYPVKVIHNGIDLSIFKPTPGNFRQTHHCQDKFVILGVAFGWGKRKGLDVFIELAEGLGDAYQIVLVGTDENAERKLPANVIAIRRTQNQEELAQLYSAADLFVNPTREENYPTVNMEALACGTPVLTFRTGGSPEIIDESCGCAVACDDISALKEEIERIRRTRPYTERACVERAKSFDMYQRFREYVDLYRACVPEAD